MLMNPLVKARQSIDPIAYLGTLRKDDSTESLAQITRRRRIVDHSDVGNLGGEGVVNRDVDQADIDDGALENDQVDGQDDHQDDIKAQEAFQKVLADNEDLAIQMEHASQQQQLLLSAASFGQHQEAPIGSVDLETEPLFRWVGPVKHLFARGKHLNSNTAKNWPQLEEQIYDLESERDSWCQMENVIVARSDLSDYTGKLELGVYPRHKKMVPKSGISVWGYIINDIEMKRRWPNVSDKPKNIFEIKPNKLFLWPDPRCAAGYVNCQRKTKGSGPPSLCNLELVIDDVYHNDLGSVQFNNMRLLPKKIMRGRYGKADGEPVYDIRTELFFDYYRSEGAEGFDYVDARPIQAKARSLRISEGTKAAIKAKRPLSDKPSAVKKRARRAAAKQEKLEEQQSDEESDAADVDIDSGAEQQIPKDPNRARGIRTRSSPDKNKQTKKVKRAPSGEPKPTRDTSNSTRKDVSDSDDDIPITQLYLKEDSDVKTETVQKESDSEDDIPIASKKSKKKTRFNVDSDDDAFESPKKKSTKSSGMYYL